MKETTERNDPVRGPGRSCPSCGAENSALDLRCRSCGAYIRDRVPSLNLFSALWGMLEAPGRTLLRIARSEQKNYVHLLFALTGPLLLASGFVGAMAGDLGAPFGILLAVLVFAGPPFGLLLLAAASLLWKSVLRSAEALHLRYRETGAFLAYALSPLMWVSVIVLPLQLGLFGLTLFSLNPPAWQLQPLPYGLLAALDATALLWSALLLPRAMHVYGISWGRGLLLTIPVWMFLAAGIAAVALLLPMIPA